MVFDKLNRLKRGGAHCFLPTAFCLLLAAFLTPVRVWAWGCDGHQTMALIAEKHMKAHALDKANKLLESQPIDPALPRYCTNQVPDLMTDASTWADDLRKVRPEASPWHYIDVPRGAPRNAVKESCGSEGCVLSALNQQMEVLRDGGNEARVRADALRFIIHLVGDLHQPLHCITNNDKGGNCVPVGFFGDVPVEKNPQFETYAPNLHAIWDAGIIEHIKGVVSTPEWAASLDRHFSADARNWEKQGINFEDWIWEGHELANSVVYGNLPVAVPVEEPVVVKSCSDDNHISARMLKLHEQVGQSYVEAATPTINEQIAKAGVRLAMILNLIWP